MPVKINLSENNNYIELIYNGSIVNDDLLYSLNKGLELMNESGINLFLADCREMTAAHSILDIFTKVQMYLDKGISKDIKEAVILPESSETADKIKFYETACLNRGFRVKVFNEKDEALNWLLD